MTLDELIDYFETARMPAFPIKYSKLEMAGPDFVAHHIKFAKAGNRFALMRLHELHAYLEKQKKRQ